MRPPERSVHSLASPGLARANLIAWAAGVPLLAVGLATASALTIATGSALLLCGVGLNLAQALTIVSGAASRPR